MVCRRGFAPPPASWSFLWRVPPGGLTTWNLDLEPSLNLGFLNLESFHRSLARRRPRPPVAPLHADAGLVRAGLRTRRHRLRRRRHPARQPGPRVSRRQQLHLDQSPRPQPPAHQRRDHRPARPIRSLFIPGSHAPARHRARHRPHRPLPRRHAHPCVLLGRRLDRHRSRPSPVPPVLATRQPTPTPSLPFLRARLPRRHARRGEPRRHPAFQATPRRAK